jgi:hypothetical protein
VRSVSGEIAGQFVPPTPGSHFNIAVHINGRPDLRNYSAVGHGASFDRGVDFIAGGACDSLQDKVGSEASDVEDLLACFRMRPHDRVFHGRAFGSQRLPLFSTRTMFGVCIGLA